MLANGARRADAFPADGSPPGSDYDLLRTQLLDKYNYFRGILTHDNGEYGGQLNSYYGAALATAVNDWNMSKWLGHDDRLFSVVVVPTGAPAAAGEEIRRVGGNERICGVLLAGNPLGRPYGDPIYEPIFAAAAEFDLAIVIHLGLVDRPNLQTTSVGAPPTTGVQSISQYSQQAMHYVSSFITHGVFEKYPNLKVLVLEYGISWLPSLMWRLDQHYELLKLESPWVRDWPSEYIRKHVKLSTQPIEEGADPSALIRVLESVDGIDELLCFSTDYPHITADDPMYVARLIPAKWHRKVFCENAADVFGWKVPEAVPIGVRG
jgi:predicted TIM-barrel fold metal-dependent hydrolase